MRVVLEDYCFTQFCQFRTSLISCDGLTVIRGIPNAWSKVKAGRWMRDTFFQGHAEYHEAVVCLGGGWSCDWRRAVTFSLELKLIISRCCISLPVFSTLTLTPMQLLNPQTASVSSYIKNDITLLATQFCWLWLPHAMPFNHRKTIPLHDIILLYSIMPSTIAKPYPYTISYCCIASCPQPSQNHSMVKISINPFTHNKTMVLQT